MEKHFDNYDEELIAERGNNNEGDNKNERN